MNTCLYLRQLYFQSFTHKVLVKIHVDYWKCDAGVAACLPTVSYNPSSTPLLGLSNGNFRSQELSLPGTKVPGMELSLPETKVPGMELTSLSLPGAKK